MPDMHLQLLYALKAYLCLYVSFFPVQGSGDKEALYLNTPKFSSTSLFVVVLFFLMYYSRLKEGYCYQAVRLPFSLSKTFQNVGSRSMKAAGECLLVKAGTIISTHYR